MEPRDLEFLVVYRGAVVERGLDVFVASIQRGATTSEEWLGQGLDLARQVQGTDWICVVLGERRYLDALGRVAQHWNAERSLAQRLQAALFGFTFKLVTRHALLAEMGRAANLVELARVELVFVLPDRDLVRGLRRTLPVRKTRERGPLLAVRVLTARSLRTK